MSGFRSVELLKADGKTSESFSNDNSDILLIFLLILLQEIGPLSCSVFKRMPLSYYFRSPFMSITFRFVILQNQEYYFYSSLMYFKTNTMMIYISLLFYVYVILTTLHQL
jgi:hypothetical protein